MIEVPEKKEPAPFEGEQPNASSDSNPSTNVAQEMERLRLRAAEVFGLAPSHVDIHLQLHVHRNTDDEDLTPAEAEGLLKLFGFSHVERRSYNSTHWLAGSPAQEYAPKVRASWYSERLAWQQR